MSGHVMRSVVVSIASTASKRGVETYTINEILTTQGRWTVFASGTAPQGALPGGVHREYYFGEFDLKEVKSWAPSQLDSLLRVTREVMNVRF